MKYKLKMLQFIPNVPSTFLWAMNAAHSRMIHSFESILFKGFIKSVGKLVNRFANQFEWFVHFPAAHADWVVWSGSHSDNIKSDEDVALDLQSIERKSAKACLLELYEDLLLDEHRVCCLLFHKYRPRYHYDITSLLYMYLIH